MLAAGGGRRLGAPKALLRHHGMLLVEYAAGTLHRGGCVPVIVVLGAAADLVLAEADLAAAEVRINPGWGSGLGSSLRAGLAAATDTEVEALVVLPVDMPGVTPEAIRRVAALPHPGALVCATFAGRRGYPMLLGRRHWPGIATLATADVGARPYLLAHAAEITEIACDQVARPDDVDTVELARRWGMEIP